MVDELMGSLKVCCSIAEAAAEKKELTDINALCDEYLRLSYHGLRAKDKSFQATFEAKLDPDVGKINIVPQDIGRIILNMINNAFYAVTEKKKQANEGYEPAVEIITKKLNDKVEIKVKDNGNGIPQKVLDKNISAILYNKAGRTRNGIGFEPCL
jgi:signal transduction histidine kinase